LIFTFDPTHYIWSMKLLLILLFSISTMSASAQFHEQSGHIWAKSSFGQIDSANYQLYGVSAEWLIHRNIGLNYNLEFIHRNDKIWQLHSSAGSIVGPPLILFGLISAAGNGNDDGDFSLGGLGALLGVILLVAPDGVSGHIPVGYHWDISPYANVLGVDYMKNNNTDLHYLRYAMSYGVKTTYWNSNGFTLNVFTETRKVAGMGWGFGGGFGMGYAFGGTTGE